MRLRLCSVHSTSKIISAARFCVGYIMILLLIAKRVFSMKHLIEMCVSRLFIFANENHWLHSICFLRTFSFSTAIHKTSNAIYMPSFAVMQSNPLEMMQFFNGIVRAQQLYTVHSVRCTFVESIERHFTR